MHGIIYAMLKCKVQLQLTKFQLQKTFLLTVVKQKIIHSYCLVAIWDEYVLEINSNRAACNQGWFQSSNWCCKLHFWLWMSDNILVLLECSGKENCFSLNVTWIDRLAKYLRFLPPFFEHLMVLFLYFPQM